MVSYALSPIDLIPDVIPILGYIDELLIIPILIITVTPHRITKKYQKLAKDYLQTKTKPKFKLGMIAVFVTWVLLASIAISTLR